MIKKLLYILFAIIACFSCVIEDDIPYPTVEGQILSMSVEGQRANEDGQGLSGVVNSSTRTVTLYVNDSVNIKRLRINSLTITDDAVLTPDSSACENVNNFPTTGFASTSSLSATANTRMDFSSPVKFVVSTYQNYNWTVTVNQIINRQVDVNNQIGKAVVDPNSRNVVIYVSPSQKLSELEVNSMSLGGDYGTVSPDPTAASTSKDYSSARKFQVTYGWDKNTSETWTVYVYHGTSETATTIDAFAMTTKASFSGQIQSGKTPVIEYKKQSASVWTTLPSANVAVSGTSFTAELTSISPNTTYQYRVSTGSDDVSETKTFTTTEAIALTNGSFDDWHQSGKVWNPWPSDGESFWDTGNKGATTISDSNSSPTDESCDGKGTAALLESKYLVLKFAAGNIFTGTYVKTDGTNGVLNFGRPFTAFPSKLRVNYKYTCMTIDKSGDTDYDYLKGRPDSCHIYIALTDWDEPYEIRTRKSERQLFDKNSDKVIAYAELIKGETVSTYQTVDLELNYRYKNRTPKYILVVASASKYGDFFVGGTGSKMWVDNFELIYE